MLFILLVSLIENEQLNTLLNYPDIKSQAIIQHYHPASGFRGSQSSFL